MDRPSPALKNRTAGRDKIQQKRELKRRFTRSALPGENEADFEKLHLQLLADLTPNGVLKDSIKDHSGLAVVQTEFCNHARCGLCQAFLQDSESGL